nr:hypothetical protein [uncultured Cetobacterium sp.]
MIIKKENDSFNFQETEDFEEATIVEENLVVDENIIKNEGLIRVDMNIIQHPIFSRNTKRKKNQIVKYFFNNNRDTYIIVSPLAGDHIPGELEERVFIALMKIIKKKGFQQKFITTCSEIKKELGVVSNTYYQKIRRSLMRLSEANYKFKNTMYSSEMKQVLSEEVSVSILNLRVLSLSDDKNKDLKKKIKDTRVKEVFEIEISDYFYDNIMKKGYLVYNSGTLLGIENSIARAIYMLIEKLRFNNSYLKVPCLFLIKRIPLKYSKKNMTNTLKVIENSLIELEEKNLIKSFNIIKETVWEEADVEIFFEETSLLDKQERFYEDRNEFRKILSQQLLISHTESEIQKDEVVAVENVTEDMINDVLDLMPYKAKSLKTLPKAIKDGIEKYGLEKVKLVAVYMKKNKVDKVRAYFIKALENDWVDEDSKELLKMIDKKKKKEEKSKDISKIDKNLEKKSEETVGNYDLYLEIIKINKELGKQIEEESKELFLNQIGSDRFDPNTKSIYEKTIKYNISKAMEKLEITSNNHVKEEKIIIKEIEPKPIQEVEVKIEKKKEKKELRMPRPEEKIELGMSRKEISNYIEEAARKYFILYGIDEDKDLEVKMEVIDELLCQEVPITKNIIDKMFRVVLRKYTDD